MEKQEEELGVVKQLNILLAVANRIGQFRKRLNKHMEGKYSPKLIALIATATATLVMIIMLFFPHYLGVADDGSVSKVMQSAGVFYMQTEVSDIYNNFFVRRYSNVLSDYAVMGDYMNSQVLVVKAAVYLDNFVTKDIYFDIRFLALLYGIFYVPALYLLIKQACMRVKKFSEGVVIGVTGVLIFTDVAYITYFNSFYPEALWFISLMYCVAAALSFQNIRSGYLDFVNIVVIVIAGIVLTMSRKQAAGIGFLLTVFCLKLLFVRKDWRWGIICSAAAFLLSITSLAAVVNLDSDFNETSKFHAMTRGVLFESDNPGETLSKFGINASYEMLTDVSAYDYLPLVTATDDTLKDGFLNQYSEVDIATYYVRHPGSFFRMLDVAIKSCFGIRREFCGNYEKTVGLPKKAKSIFWSSWSTFKNNSAPKTIGYLIVLVGAVVVLFSRGYSIRSYENRRNTVFLDMMMVLLFICLLEAGITIICSGDAEMVQHCFLVSYGIDLLTYFVFAEIVHKINIF